jgi:quercetin dioxygenase-like cupin family protein
VHALAGTAFTLGDVTGHRLNPGDVVFAPDGEEHWHGARPDHFMTHLSITEGAPRWGAHVSDAEYRS